MLTHNKGWGTNTEHWNLSCPAEHTISVAAALLCYIVVVFFSSGLKIKAKNVSQSICWMKMTFVSAAVRYASQSIYVQLINQSAINFHVIHLRIWSNGIGTAFSHKITLLRSHSHRVISSRMQRNTFSYMALKSATVRWWQSMKHWWNSA